MWSRFAISTLLWLISAGGAWAQMTPDRLLGAAAQAKNLVFPGAATELSSATTPGMALYKPDGPGPFPALVLLHHCGGLSQPRWKNESMLAWAREAVARGYVALLVDSLGPRGVESVCQGARGGVNFMRGVKDGLQAARHLKTLDFVDKQRIALAGFSWGGMVGTLASSQLWGNTLGDGERFAAVVAFYPGCHTIRPSNGAPYGIVNEDIDRPLLVLMGARDTETPPSDCVPKLEAAQATGAPVTWHVYPGATHCWDCEKLNGFSKVDARGQRVEYVHDASATQDAARRMFEFLQDTLPKRP